VNAGPDLSSWLRETIGARLALAREASPHTGGHWWRRTSDIGEAVGALYAGEPILDADGEVWGGDYVVVYDEGAPSDAQFDHIAANDPRSVIARCEADLDIFYLHAGEWHEEDADGYDYYRPRQVCTHCDDGYWPCRTVRLLGYGYRFRPGYREEWAP